MGLEALFFHYGALQSLLVRNCIGAAYIRPDSEQSHLALSLRRVQQWNSILVYFLSLFSVKSSSDGRAVFIIIIIILHMQINGLYITFRPA